MSAEKQPSYLLERKEILDGAWSFQAQLNALRSAPPGGGEAGGGVARDPLAFKETSVKDITDKGRVEGAARLQKALELALDSAAAEERSAGAAKRKLQLTSAPGQAPDEADVRRQVLQHLASAQRLRRAEASPKRDASMMRVLRHLSDLDISVGCLKSTKIAAELNQPFWKSEAPAEVGQFAVGLVKEWRRMFRAETGADEQPAMAPAVRARKCRSISMDLEDSAYGRQQRVGKYVEIVNWTCRILLGDREVSKSLLNGSLASRDLLQRASEEVQQRNASRKHALVNSSPAPFSC